MQASSSDTLQWALALAPSRDANGISEAHGVITGLITGQPAIELDALWHHWALLNLDNDLAVDDPANPKAEFWPHLEAALGDIQQALRSTELAFDALVPAQDQPLSQRTDGLAHWCGGFLAGFGASGATIQDDEAQQALTLLGEIARASSESDDDSADQEDEERALSELLEFVKVAVLLLHDDRRLQAARADSDTPIAQTNEQPPAEMPPTDPESDDAAG